MKNFNELFEQAGKVADRRRKVFNELIEKTKTEILPAFCEKVESLDIAKVYFKMNRSLLSGNDSKPQETDYDEYMYCYCINVQEKSIQDAEYDFASRRYHVPAHWTMLPIQDVTFARTAIVEFVKILNNRLEAYISRFNEENKGAEILLK